MNVVAGEDCSGVIDVQGNLFVWGDGYKFGTMPFDRAVKQVNAVCPARSLLH